VWSLATAVRVVVGAPVEDADRSGHRIVDRFPCADADAVGLWWHRFAIHLTPRSVYFQGAVRIAVALAAARLVAGTFELSHGFWVLLATLTLLRGRAATTGLTLGPAAVGTVVGAAASGVLLVLVGARPDVYAAITPPVMILAFLGGAFFGLAWGQALFTVLVTLVFTQLAPSGVQIAEVRVLDVIVGAMIGVTAGALAWPRGASAALRRSAARLLVACGDLVRDTVRVLTQLPPPGQPAAMPTVQNAMALVEAAYAAYEAERQGGGPTTDWAAVLTAGDHVVRGASLLLATHEPGSLAPWRSVVTGWADTVGAATDTRATALRARRPQPLSTVVGPAQDIRLADIQVWLVGVLADLSRVIPQSSRTSS
jgi:uncharacterized membrane protein YccC